MEKPFLEQSPTDFRKGQKQPAWIPPPPCSQHHPWEYSSPFSLGKTLTWFCFLYTAQGLPQIPLFPPAAQTISKPSSEKRGIFHQFLK